MHINSGSAYAPSALVYTATHTSVAVSRAHHSEMVANPRHSSIRYSLS